MGQLNSKIDHAQMNQENINFKSTQWVDLISALFDRLTGKEAVVTYEFDNIVVDRPKTTAPGEKKLGSAK